MVDPKTKQILLLLGAGTFLAASLVMPGLPLLIKPILDEKRKREQDEWKKFNAWRLRQIIKRLHKRKLVEVVQENGTDVVKITEDGRKKTLRYKIDEMTIIKKRWDGKWRIIIYDIFSKKKAERHLFHKILKRLQFYQLQRSVYLTPFPCHEEIEYLRKICDVDKEVLILTVQKLENEKVYREYFGI